MAAASLGQERWQIAERRLRTLRSTGDAGGHAHVLHPAGIEQRPDGWRRRQPRELEDKARDAHCQKSQKRSETKYAATWVRMKTTWPGAWTERVAEIWRALRDVRRGTRPATMRDDER